MSRQKPLRKRREAHGGVSRDGEALGLEDRDAGEGLDGHASCSVEVHSSANLLLVGHEAERHAGEGLVGAPVENVVDHVHGESCDTRVLCERLVLPADLRTNHSGIIIVTRVLLLCGRFVLG